MFSVSLPPSKRFVICRWLACSGYNSRAGLGTRSDGRDHRTRQHFRDHISDHRTCSQMGVSRNGGPPKTDGLQWNLPFKSMILGSCLAGYGLGKNSCLPCAFPATVFSGLGISCQLFSVDRFWPSFKGGDFHWLQWSKIIFWVGSDELWCAGLRSWLEEFSCDNPHNIQVWNMNESDIRFMVFLQKTTHFLGWWSFMSSTCYRWSGKPWKTWRIVVRSSSHEAWKNRAPGVGKGAGVSWYLAHFDLGVSLVMGVPLVIIHLKRIFPEINPSSYWSTFVYGTLPYNCLQLLDII